MIFVYSRVSYMTYVPLQISCRVPLSKTFFLSKCVLSKKLWEKYTFIEGNLDLYRYLLMLSRQKHQKPSRCEQFCLIPCEVNESCDSLLRSYFFPCKNNDWLFARQNTVQSAFYTHLISYQQFENHYQHFQNFWKRNLNFFLLKGSK